MDIFYCLECTAPLGPLMATFAKIVAHYHDLQKKSTPEVSLSFLRSTEGRRYSRQLYALESAGYIITVDHGEIISIKPQGFDVPAPADLAPSGIPVFCLKGHKHEV